MTCNDALSMSLPSAGIWSPASTMTISPTTTSSEGMTAASPFLSTLALGEESFLRLVRLFSALRVWIVPRMAFIVMTVRITTVLSASPVMAEMIAAMIRIITRKSLYCSRKMRRGVFFLPSVRAFLPYFSALCCACWEVRPSREVPSSLQTSSGD